MVEPISITAAPGGPAPVIQPSLPIDFKDEASIRAMANAAEAQGDGVVALNGAAQTTAVQPTVPQTPTAPAPVPATTAVPATQPTPAPQASTEVPAKFLKPDGTVDVEKLQASTKQLDAALQEKVMSIDEMVAAYKEKERQFRNLPKAPEQVARLAQQVVQPPVAPPPMAAPAPIPMAPDPATVYQHLSQEYQRDPFGTVVDLVKVMMRQESAPVQQFIESQREREHDDSIKANLVELAKDDPRVANTAIYNQIVAELERDPGYWNLRNPHKAAWNEVKARLRLGETQLPAQPSKTPSPILGGGTPPPVPSTTGQPTPANVGAAIQQAKGKDELAMVEQELRRMTAQGW